MQRSWLLWVTVAATLGCSSTPGDSNSGAMDPSTGDGSSAEDGNAGDGDEDGSDDESPGDGAVGDGDGDGTDDGVCEEQAVRSERVTPDILIVLDRSGSMDPSGNNGVDRWGGSVSGIKAITAALDGSVNFGLMTFPSDDSCGPGTLNVPIAGSNAGAIATALDGIRPEGGTPTSDSLDAAREVLAGIQPAPGEAARPKYVFLVTDGAPNCSETPNPLECILAPDPVKCLADLLANANDQAAVDESVEAVKALAAASMKTYVIGYNTKNVAQLASALDKMAVVGDTGDTAHRAVEDQAQLVAEFEAIAGAAVSCEFVLAEAPSDPSYVQVTLDGEQLNLNEADGWVISEDRKTVTVQGRACADLQSGARQQLGVKVLCEVVIPQ